jgi:hypothetical protein
MKHCACPNARHRCERAFLLAEPSDGSPSHQAPDSMPGGEAHCSMRSIELRLRGARHHWPWERHHEECSYLAFHPRRSRLGGIDSFSFLFFVPRFQPWAGVPVGRLHAWFEFEYRWAWRNPYIRQPSRIRALRVRAAWPTFPAASDSVRHTGPDWAQAAGAILYFRGVTPWASLVPTPYAAAAAVSIPISTIDWFFPCRRRAQSQSQLLDKRQASPSRSRVIW